ncbi:MAG: histidine-type phosphatase [Bacteroidales bacterium]
MKKFLTALVLLFSFFTLFAQIPSKKELLSTPELTAAFLYAYPVTVAENTPAPKGYIPFYISHYGRHGSRWLTSDGDYVNIYEVFNKAYSDSVLTPLGKDVRRRLAIICEDARGRSGDLTSLGVRQHRAIAERMYKNYPQVFAGDAKIDAKSTTVIRCILSMDAFCEKLKEENPDLEITRQASQRYMYYMNHTGKEYERWIRDTTLAWRANYRFLHELANPERLMSVLFTNPGYCKENMSSAAVMSGLFQIASDMQNVDPGLSLYDLFTPRELFDLWQAMNYRYYVTLSTSPESGGLAVANAINLLTDILDKAHEAVEGNGTAANLRFGHDGNITPLAGLMQLDDNRSSEKDPLKIYTVWNASVCTPKASNIQLVFFRHKKNKDVIVKILHNEREVSIPVGTDIYPYYHWQDVECFYREVMEK